MPHCPFQFAADFFAAGNLFACELLVGTSICRSLTPALAPSSVCDNFKRKSMPERTVFCEKLKQQLPGLPEPPFDSALGQKIYEHVSQQAWNQWMEFCKMLLNEYRLNPARKQDQEVIVKQMEQFFFGEGAAPPEEYVPPTH